MKTHTDSLKAEADLTDVIGRANQAMADYLGGQLDKLKDLFQQQQALERVARARSAEAQLAFAKAIAGSG